MRTLDQKQRGIEQNDGVNAKEDFIVDVYVGINSNDEDAVSSTHASIKWGKDGQLTGSELAKAMAVYPPTHSFYLVDRTWQIDEATTAGIGVGVGCAGCSWFGCDSSVAL